MNFEHNFTCHTSELVLSLFIEAIISSRLFITLWYRILTLEISEFLFFISFLSIASLLSKNHLLYKTERNIHIFVQSEIFTFIYQNFFHVYLKSKREPSYISKIC